MENGINETETEVSDSGQGSGEGPGFSIGNIPRKRGRPPGSRNKGTPIDTGATAKPRVVDAPTVDQVEASKFIALGVVSLIELFESFVHSNGAKKIERKFPDKLPEFRKLCEDMGLQRKEKELIETTVARIAARYEFMTRYAPELVLGVTLAQYGVRQMSLMSFVEKTTKEPTEVKVESKPVAS